MQVIVRHDNIVQGSQRLTELTTTTIAGVLERYAEHLTTVEVHYADESGAKGGNIRCAIEARFEGRKPSGVTHHAADLDVALEGAAEKMLRSLEHHLGRIREPING